MPNFDVTEDSLRPIVAKALFDELEPQKRDMLMQAALETLFEPKVTQAYGRQERQPSIIENLMRERVTAIAKETVAIILDDPKVAKQIQDAVRKGVVAAIRDEKSWLFDAVGEAIGQKVAAMMRGDL